MIVWFNSPQTRRTGPIQRAAADVAVEVGVVAADEAAGIFAEEAAASRVVPAGVVVIELGAGVPFLARVVEQLVDRFRVIRGNRCA
jgi:hypothetical protein